jgi:predicted phosphodiesterase
VARSSSAPARARQPLSGDERPVHTAAVLADIHGNAVALAAVLAELEAEPVDCLIVAGDVAAGPQPRETIALLRSLPGARFVRGNADREIVEAADQGTEFDGGEDDPAIKTAAWAAARLDADDIAFLRGFEPVVRLRQTDLGDVLVCHGTPESDEGIITSLTPERELRRLLAGVGTALVVGGHTHVQFDRATAFGRFVNAGSIGMPYQDVPGAYWLRLGPDVALRHTRYDLEAAVTAAQESGYWETDDFAEVITRPPPAGETEAFFERVASERGERPGSGSEGGRGSPNP